MTSTNLRAGVRILNKQQTQGIEVHVQAATNLPKSRLAEIRHFDAFPLLGENSLSPLKFVWYSGTSLTQSNVILVEHSCRSFGP